MLPKKGTPEFAELEKRYLASTKEERNQMAREYGYGTRNNFQMSMSKSRGILLPPQKKVVIQNGEEKPKTVERKPIVELPPVNLIEYRGKEVKEEGDEEIAILHVGDGHADKITASYNKDVYRARMETMFQSAIKIVKLHRKMYPINKLLILNTGDNIQGENPHQGSKIGGVSMGARDQVKKLAAPMWNDIIGSFKQNFVEVIFEGFPGNHGHDLLAPETSRYDLLLYDVLEAGIGQNKGIKINTHESWCAIIPVWGWRLFGFHGDGIPCLAPSTKILNADLRWIPISEVNVGDMLVGFRENVPYNRNVSHRLQRSEVLGKTIKQGKLYKIETDKGSVVASGNHLWLAAKEGWDWHRYEWIRTDNLASHYIKYIGDTWGDGGDYKLGYLGGILDGEGTIHKRSQTAGSGGVGFYQCSGVVWDYTNELLNELGFIGTTSSSRGVKSWECYGYQALRLLGSARPNRLLAKADCIWDNKNIRASERAKVLNITDIGFGELIDIETSTNTFIAEGMYTHNCQQGVPFFALDRRLKAWHMQFGGFNYAFGGHFHKEHSDEISSRLKYFMVSSLTSDDEWAQKKLGISSNPSQGLYGLHPREGITWRYSLVVDEKFLPEPLEHQLTLPAEKLNHAE